MTKIEFFKSAEGGIIGFTAIGHSGYAQRGSDIVCAAISALMTTAVNAIEKLTQVEPQVQLNAKNGEMRVVIPSVKDISTKHDINIILSALIIGLNDIQSEYPKHLKIKETMQ